MLISRFQNNNVQERIHGLEKEYNIDFPQQYGEFLCKYNGGHTPNTEYGVGRKSIVIRGFYGFGDVEFSIDNINVNKWLNKNVFPIACDTFGNEIVISLMKEESGKIYFCDHERGYSKKLIEEDFSTFIKKCKSKEINPYSRRSIEEREADLIARGKGGNITEGLRKMWQKEIDKYVNMVQEEVIIK